MVEHLCFHSHCALAMVNKVLDQLLGSLFYSATNATVVVLANSREALKHVNDPLPQIEQPVTQIWVLLEFKIQQVSRGGLNSEKTIKPFCAGNQTKWENWSVLSYLVLPWAGRCEQEGLFFNLALISHWPPEATRVWMCSPWHFLKQQRHKNLSWIMLWQEGLSRMSKRTAGKWYM